MATRKSSHALVNKGETSEKEMDTFALLRQDIKDLKDRLEKKVKSDDLEILVTSIVKSLLKAHRSKIKEEINNRVEDKMKELEAKYIDKMNKLQERVEFPREDAGV